MNSKLEGIAKEKEQDAPALATLNDKMAIEMGEQRNLIDSIETKLHPYFE